MFDVVFIKSQKRRIIVSVNKDGVWTPEDPEKEIQRELNEPDPAGQPDEEDETEEGDQALIKKKEYVQYNRLIEQAKTEGRIGGKFKCVSCGMRYHEKYDAYNCCKLN